MSASLAGSSGESGSVLSVLWALLLVSEDGCASAVASELESMVTLFVSGTCDSISWLSAFEMLTDFSVSVLGAFASVLTTGADNGSDWVLCAGEAYWARGLLGVAGALFGAALLAGALCSFLPRVRFILFLMRLRSPILSPIPDSKPYHLFQ